MHESTDAVIPSSVIEFKPLFDSRLRGLLADGGVFTELREAVLYAVLAPGKRIRPYLLVRCCELVGGQREDAWAAAAALECIHTFSLVHDDLPALDNDDLRRGRPTTHHQFGEAMAILAGDALIMLAFEILTRQSPDPARASALVFELAAHAGWTGMIGGQAADMTAQNTPPSIDTARYIHERKTACLFTAACRMGAMAGKGKTEEVEALGAFGRHLGGAFQIADDLLDVSSDAQTLGKKTGKDARAGKQTYPACVGVDESRSLMHAAVEAAIRQLDRFGAAADDLREIAHYSISRNY